MMLKYCTQYVSKFGKLSSGHRTGKGQSSFQSQMRAIPKNIQTIPQLYLFHMLARLCSKFFKLGFSNMWTESFQMYKLDLEKAEEPEIKLPKSVGSYKKQRNFLKIYFCFIDYAKAFSKYSMYTYKFLVHILLKPSLKDFEHYLASMWNECNCVVVWTFFGIALLYDWKENWFFFSSCMATAKFSKFAGILNAAL